MGLVRCILEHSLGGAGGKWEHGIQLLDLRHNSSLWRDETSELLGRIVTYTLAM